MASKDCRILLVEDHLDTRQIIARLLRLWGHQVTDVGSVNDALDEASKCPFDLAVCDLGLPDGSGFELMEQLKRQYQLPGIALSGYAMEQDIRRSGEAGFAMHLSKPVDMYRLREALDQVIGGGGAKPDDARADETP